MNIARISLGLRGASSSILIFLLAACEGYDGYDSADEPADDNADVIGESDKVALAKLDIEGGSQLRFFEISSPDGMSAISYLYTADPEAPPLVESVVKQEATPLELFLAFAPADLQPPEALIDHHRRQAEMGSAAEIPRILDVSVPYTEVLTTPCGVSGTSLTYYQLWFNSFLPSGLSKTHQTWLSTNKSYSLPAWETVYVGGCHLSTGNPLGLYLTLWRDNHHVESGDLDPNQRWFYSVSYSSCNSDTFRYNTHVWWDSIYHVSYAGSHSPQCTT